MNRTPRIRRAVLVIGLLALSACMQSARAIEPVKAGAGRLEIVRGVPVAHLSGTPEQIGEQHGRLLAAEIKLLMEKYVGRFFDTSPLGRTARLSALAVAYQMRIPDQYKREMKAIARASGVSYEDILLANTMFDTKKTLQCTTVAAFGEHTADGGLLFGRNLDFPGFGVVHRYSTVFAIHPEGGEPFISVAFPGMVGVLSGMNRPGVAVAVMECYGHGMTSKAEPYAMVFRRALEKAKNVDDVTAVVRAAERSTANNLMVCDATPQAIVIEMTPRKVAVRKSTRGFIAAINHFQSPQLRQTPADRRLPILDAFSTKQADLDSVKGLLRATAMGGLNLQAMIFEPQTRKLHLAIGTPPAANRKYVTLTARELGLDREGDDQ